MRLIMFHVGDGDCVLVTSGGKRILVDGGRKAAFRKHVRDHLYALNKLDVVCVSHIDDDHISGILAMIEDEVEKRVHDFELAEDPSTPPKNLPQPPKISKIWHNGLFELVGDDLEPEVAEALASSVMTFAASSNSVHEGFAHRLENLATGERSSMELSRRISDSQLGIKRNRPRNKIMMRKRAGSRLQVGPLTIRVLGPSQEDLDALRKRWSIWKNKNNKTLRTLQAEMLEDEDRLGLFESTVASASIAADLGDGATSITAPNLASLTLWVEDDEHTLILTGDADSVEILNGLAHCRRLTNGKVHVNALKVQHHGASANVTEEFVESVTADHYLFCGNGAHHNPELEVVEAFVRA